jgi:hypothetical protein
MAALDQLLQQLSDGSGLSWKDETYDLALARGLSESDRATYVAKLMERVENGDGLAALTLGHLGAAEALPMLLALGKRTEEGASIARRALVLLGRGADVITEIAHDAVSSEDKMERFAAVVDLPKVGGQVAIFALQQALLDEDSDVRVVAWDGLIEALGLTKRLQNPQGVRELNTEVEVMRVLLGTELFAVARIGANRMREIAKRLATGTSPHQLGIAWRTRASPEVFDKLRRAIFDRTIPFPLDDIAKLRGVERQLAEAMIARRLEEWDERAPAALARLEAAWLAPALDELAGSDHTPTELRANLAAAVRGLTRDRR